jgi:SEFIR domain
MAVAPRVFISYSYDSEEHADRVLALADALCDGGIDVILDRYVHPAPAEGWPLWMDRYLDEAEFVLMVCTEIYARRVMGPVEPGKGLGVLWEGRLISNRIYYDKPSGSAVHPDPAARLGAGAHPQSGSGACLLPDRDVRPDRPGLRGPVPSPDRSTGHAPA